MDGVPEQGQSLAGIVQLYGPPVGRRREFGALPSGMRGGRGGSISRAGSAHSRFGDGQVRKDALLATSSESRFRNRAAAPLLLRGTGGCAAGDAPPETRRVDLRPGPPPPLLEAGLRLRPRLPLLLLLLVR